MRIGTTGSRNRRPESTCEAFRALLIEKGATELHHGDCVGWDAQAHDIAKSLGLRVVVHPPDSDSMRAFCKGGFELLPKPYLKRNMEIVRECEFLIAAPDGPERLRSGTWSTVRYAKKVGRRGVVIGLQSV